ncbi:MAG: hypothetical protein KTR31_07110 [Myxococcales bacterium]|nr:hypothetical protein [Myxococcales bacterium]
MSNQARWAIVELLCTIALPAAALMLLTDADRLGPAWGLVVALAPPLLWGVFVMVRDRSVSALAVISVVSVTLTGGVGLLQLDPTWFAVKEGAVGMLLGGLVMATAPTRHAMIPVLLDKLVDTERLQGALRQAGQPDAYVEAGRRATIQAGLLMLASGVASFGLARWIVRSAAGTEAFGDELGRFTLLSFPVIGLPTTLAMVWVLERLLRRVEDASSLDRDDFLKVGG